MISCSTTQAWLFKHEHFLRDNRSPLSLIRRKAAKTDMSPVLTGTPNASVMNLAVDVSSSFSGYVDAGPQQLLPTTIAADTVALGTGKTHSKGRTATASNAATPQALAVLAKKLQGTHLALVDVQQTNQRLEAEVNRLRSRIDGQEKMFSQMVTAVLNVERGMLAEGRSSCPSILRYRVLIQKFASNGVAVSTPR